MLFCLVVILEKKICQPDSSSTAAVLVFILLAGTIVCLLLGQTHYALSKAGRVCLVLHWIPNFWFVRNLRSFVQRFSYVSCHEVEPKPYTWYCSYCGMASAAVWHHTPTPLVWRYTGRHACGTRNPVRARATRYEHARSKHQIQLGSMSFADILDF